MKPSHPDQLRNENDDDVTASEVAAYAYCAKAWHLERVLERSVDIQAQHRRAEGVERHVEHGASVRQSQRPAWWSRRAIFALLLLALALLAVALLL
ncbi:MAG TPA: hypothetical protein VM076_08020 [Gemmatimonadaceae bacterium]|nr:hypothetical protein [Gemmatimonadaceae bacterium]